LAQLGRHPGSGEADDDGIVSGKHDVDDDHVEERE
jgi:hypothetical protein